MKTVIGAPVTRSKCEAPLYSRHSFVTQTRKRIVLSSQVKSLAQGCPRHPALSSGPVATWTLTRPPASNPACPAQPPRLLSAPPQLCLQAPTPPWVRLGHILSIFSLSSLIRNFNKILIKISGFYGCSGPLIKLDAIKLLSDEEQMTGVSHISCHLLSRKGKSSV